MASEKSLSMPFCEEGRCVDIPSEAAVSLLEGVIHWEPWLGLRAESIRLILLESTGIESPHRMWAAHLALSYENRPCVCDDVSDHSNAVASRRLFNFLRLHDCARLLSR